MKRKPAANKSRRIKPTIPWPDFETEGEDSWHFLRRLRRHSLIVSQAFQKERLHEWRRRGAIDTPEALEAAERTVRERYRLAVYPLLTPEGARPYIKNAPRFEFDKLYEGLGGYAGLLAAMHQSRDLRIEFYRLVIQQESAAIVGKPVTKKAAAARAKRDGLEDLSNEMSLEQLMASKDASGSNSNTG